ncbi:MAG: Fpg/Nei family DNA glycosylase [Candidatus Eisenbacteria bacterium]|nr:Fpg/Nei family DNA glycosylase [Candidatus Eisenbacteria bacterium]
MPELPEIMSRAIEMKEALAGKTIAEIEVLQPKCLNVSAKAFKAGLAGAKIVDVSYRGKWLFVETTRGWLLINLGMGGEILLTKRTALPKKRRLIIYFSDRTCLSLNFWWFGYAHYVAPDRLDKHAMTADLGPNALSVTTEELRGILKGRRGAVKSMLLDQSRIAGIGNAYIHDILFMARLHPLRTIDTLGESELDALAKAIDRGLRPSARKGGAFYELNLYGKPGGFKARDIIIGYKEGKPCPTCGTKIEKIKTGSNSTFICSTCQPLKPIKKKRSKQA